MNEAKGSPQFVGFLWLFAGVLLASSLAVGLPWFAQRIPWSWETRMAQALGHLSPGPVCSGSPMANKAFHKLVARIYPIYPIDHGFPVNIEIVRGSEINAFATLGGEIYVYSGLLEQAQSPEELAGVLAHEIEHVHHRHIIQGVVMKLAVLQGLSAIFTGGPGDMSPQIAEIFLNLKFSKTQEAEADDDGFKRLHDGQVDVRGLQAFFKRLDAQGESLPALLSDHPAGLDRARMAERYSSGPSLPLLSPTEWKALRTICK